MEFLKDLCETYEEYALEKKIRYKWMLPVERSRIWFDREQMQKVFYNMLSFAFNGAQATDEVSLFCGWKNGCVEIRISTTRQIKDEKMWREIAGMINSDTANEGNTLPDNGIGLAFSRGIVQMHGGSMHFEYEGGSMQFTLCLLPGKSHFPESDWEENPERAVFTESASFLPASSASGALLSTSDNSVPAGSEFLPDTGADNEGIEKAKAEESETRKYRMLLVGQKDELRSLLQDACRFLYQVEAVDEGSAGYTYAVKEEPDIILSEVNIPGLSGIEMCTMLKQNVLTLHIPVILITAHPSEEQQIEGIRSGASDYIVAPFNLEKLLLRCNSLVKNQRKILLKYTKEIDLEKNEMATNAQDQEFLVTANRVLEAHADSTGFDIAAWGKELGIGRTRLFHKIKAITGLTPNEYILQAKMKKSLILLTGSEQLTIAEIAYRLGFSNPAYFSKCFKKQFGMTPQEYRKN